MTELIVPPQEIALLEPTIFNTAKTDYDTPNLFLGQPQGLFDTINRRFPTVWDLYKSMKSLDWDEEEFGFVSCNAEFKSRDPRICTSMIRTLAWQWETDSVAGRTILPVMAPFITSSELQAAWTRITDNENLHASTYSEIVRFSFDDPAVVMQEVLRIKEAMQRLKTVADVMAKVYRISHEYALGQRENNQETYNAAFMFTVALLILERIQFIASFAVTFGIAETGAFMPIGKSVQKIAQDELEVHVQLDKLILANELKTARGQQALRDCKDLILRMISEVVAAEHAWVDYLANDGCIVPNAGWDQLKALSAMSAGDVYESVGLLPEMAIPRKCPVEYLPRWLNISKMQASPQEQDNGQYRTNLLQRTDQGKVYDIEF